MSQQAEPVWQTRPSAGSSSIAATVSIVGDPVTFDEFIGGLSSNAAFRAAFVQTLRDVPFEAYCWEVPPLVPAALDRPFECTFVDSPALARSSADPAPFAEHFGPAPCSRFASLGGDAILVAPAPHGPPDAYTHLAVFARGAPATQVDSLWTEVAAAARQRIGREPTWLSTAGLGVSWLHVRLDTRPKYYRTRAYADPEYWTRRPTGGSSRAR